MQRSYSVKSSKVLNGPSPKLPRSRGARRDSPNGVIAGIRPLAGLTIRDVSRNVVWPRNARSPPAPPAPAGVGARGVIRGLTRLLFAFHAVCVLLISHEYPAALGDRPFARHAMDAVARPCARKVRVTPGRPGGLPAVP